MLSTSDAGRTDDHQSQNNTLTPGQAKKYRNSSLSIEGWNLATPYYTYDDIDLMDIPVDRRSSLAKEFLNELPSEFIKALETSCQWKQAHSSTSLSKIKECENSKVTDAIATTNSLDVIKFDHYCEGVDSRLSRSESSLTHQQQDNQISISKCRNLLNFIDEKCPKSETRRMLRQLIAQSKPQQSKWYDPARPGQAELYDSFESLLQQLRTYHPHSQPFLHRVNRKDVPDYFDVIKNPMDLSTMQKKMKAFVYQNKNQFITDLELIYANCYTYNSDPSSPFRRHVDYLRERWTSMLPTIPDISIGPSLKSSSLTDSPGSVGRHKREPPDELSVLLDEHLDEISFSDLSQQSSLNQNGENMAPPLNWNIPARSSVGMTNYAASERTDLPYPELQYFHQFFPDPKRIVRDHPPLGKENTPFVLRRKIPQNIKQEVEKLRILQGKSTNFLFSEQEDITNEKYSINNNFSRSYANHLVTSQLAWLLLQSGYHSFNIDGMNILCDIFNMITRSICRSIKILTDHCDDPLILMRKICEIYTDRPLYLKSFLSRDVERRLKSLDRAIKITEEYTLMADRMSSDAKLKEEMLDLEDDGMVAESDIDLGLLEDDGVEGVNSFPLDSTSTISTNPTSSQVNRSTSQSDSEQETSPISDTNERKGRVNGLTNEDGVNKGTVDTMPVDNMQQNNSSSSDSPANRKQWNPNGDFTQITDAVTQTNVRVVGEKPAISLGSGYQSSLNSMMNYQNEGVNQTTNNHNLLFANNGNGPSTDILNKQGSAEKITSLFGFVANTPVASDASPMPTAMFHNEPAKISDSISNILFEEGEKGVVGSGVAGERKKSIDESWEQIDWKDLPTETTFGSTIVSDLPKNVEVEKHDISPIKPAQVDELIKIDTTQPKETSFKIDFTPKKVDETPKKIDFGQKEEAPKKEPEVIKESAEQKPPMSTPSKVKEEIKLQTPEKQISNNIPEVKKEAAETPIKTPKQSTPRTPKSAAATPETPRSSGRVRKAVNRLSPSFADQPRNDSHRPVEIPAGNGTKLGDIPHVAKELGKRKADYAAVVLLHRLAFGRPGEATKRKANLRQFKGLSPDTVPKDGQCKIMNHTMEELRDLCGLLNVERGGEKGALGERIANFLIHPADLGESKPSPKRTRAKTSPSPAKKKLKTAKSTESLNENDEERGEEDEEERELEETMEDDDEIMIEELKSDQ